MSAFVGTNDLHYERFEINNPLYFSATSSPTVSQKPTSKKQELRARYYDFASTNKHVMVIIALAAVGYLSVVSYREGYRSTIDDYDNYSTSGLKKVVEQSELSVAWPEWAKGLVKVSRAKMYVARASRETSDTETERSPRTDPLEEINWKEHMESNNLDYEPERKREEWKHRSSVGSKEFVVCFHEGQRFNFFGAYNFINEGLKKPGMCVKDVKVSANIDDPSCDVRMFRNQHVPESRKKTRAGQVDIFFTHESPSGYSPEMNDREFRGSFDYIANYEKTSGLWFPFAVPVFEMKKDFPLYTIPRKDRNPGVAWLARDCMSNRANTLRKISEHYPVFSVGNCAKNVVSNSFPESVMDLPRERQTSFQEPLSNFMFYFAVENLGVSCPEYVTEKIYYALSRGSIPIYIGWEGVNELLPGRDSWIDLRDYETPEALAKKLRQIADNDDEWEKMHKWRYEDPKSWPMLFQKAIRQQTEDSKYALCALLQNGESDKRRQAGKDPKLCAQETKIFGESLQVDGQSGFGAFKKKDDEDEAKLGRVDLVDDRVKDGDNKAASQIFSPWEKHLKKTCSTDHSCFKFV
jgi:hypothetical protein